VLFHKGTFWIEVEGLVRIVTTACVMTKNAFCQEKFGFGESQDFDISQ
jgi:hypothetical protein